MSRRLGAVKHDIYWNVQTELKTMILVDRNKRLNLPVFLIWNILNTPAWSILNSHFPDGDCSVWAIPRDGRCINPAQIENLDVRANGNKSRILLSYIPSK